MGPIDRFFLWLVPDDAWARFENHHFWRWIEDHALTLTVAFLLLMGALGLLVVTCTTR